MDRRQARVARPRAVAALRWELIEKRGDGVGVEISDVEHFP
jgi:hypothetical protein